MFKNREMNMCEGALLKKLIIYALPLLATNVLQLLFNAADVAVLGIFAGDDPVAAVGATAALINLIVGLFIGALIDLIQLQIDHTGKEKFVVIGLTSGDAGTWDNTNGKLAAAFGENFLDVKSYLASEQALKDAGIAPTETDLAYIAKGQIPKSLYCDDTDETHLSDVAYELLAKQVYAKLIALGYIEE